MLNADQAELDKFGDLAHRWWDPNSEFKPLHEINPLRTRWIDQAIGLNGKKIIDIGCGGGLLSEAMATQGAHVTGIDLSDKALGVAKLHLLESGAKVDYRHIAAETMAAEHPCAFDAVTCLEMLEHVPDPQQTIDACAKLVKAGGDVFLSTLNRNPKAYLFAIIGAEYVLNMLPKGTHDYAKFIKPAELVRMARHAGLDLVSMIGMSYNPITKVYSLGNDTSVNYMIHLRRSA